MTDINNESKGVLLVRSACYHCYGTGFANSESPQLEKDPLELCYSATARCPCGAGLAYYLNEPKASRWFCSDVLLNIALMDVTHTSYPFIFYEILEESQPSAEGRTTRPTNAK